MTNQITQTKNEIIRVYDDLKSYAKLTIENAIRLGELLSHQKELLGHGAWGDWVDENLPFSSKSVQRYMKLYANREHLKNDNVSYLGEAYKLLTDSKDEPDQENIEENQSETGYENMEAKESEPDANDIPIEGEIVDEPEPATRPKTVEAEVMDSVGNVVPQSLRQLFLDQQEIKNFMRQLDTFKTDVLQAAKEKPKLWHFFRINPFGVEVGNIKRVLKFTLPFSICPFCRGRGPMECCCKSGGFLNADMYNALPEDKKKK
jgi:hypothetical protein